MRLNRSLQFDLTDNAVLTLNMNLPGGKICRTPEHAGQPAYASLNGRSAVWAVHISQIEREVVDAVSQTCAGPIVSADANADVVSTWHGPSRIGILVTAADVRERLTRALRLDLVGPEPSDPQAEEVLDRSPSRWYLTGFLVPSSAPATQKSDEDDRGDFDLEASPGGDEEDATQLFPRSFSTIVCNFHVRDLKMVSSSVCNRAARGERSCVSR